MDIQLILIFILAILTINLVFVGFYAILVLKDFRQTLKKSNSVLDDLHTVTGSIASPITSIVGVVNGVVEGIKAVRGITSLRDIKREEDEEYV